MSKWISKLLKLSSCGSVSDKVFYTRTLISFFCIIICMTAMLSSAYAWFLADVSSGENVLSSANYSIEVSADSEDSDVEIDANSYIYYCGISKEDKHYFTLTATGTAKNGYCRIIITEDQNGENKATTYETAYIGQGKELKVCVQAALGCSIQFIPVWAAAENVSTFSLRRTEIFHIQHSTTPHVEYLVLEGVTLEALAEYYGVSADDICIYNGISELTVGETIKIPGIEDESMEPYQPPQADVATPSNATPSNAEASDATPPNAESTASTESGGEQNGSEEIPVVGTETENGAINESTLAAESETASESTSATESGSAIENTSEAESESSSENMSVAESAVQSIPLEMSTEDIESTKEADVAESITETSTHPEPTS